MDDKVMKNRICMILMSEFTHDARVTKEINTLHSEGYEVVVIALKNRKTPKTERRETCTVYRMNLGSRYVLPKGQLFFFIKYVEFFIRVLFFSKQFRFNLFHAHDLETLPIGFVVSRIHHRPLIYDSHEIYTELEKHNLLSRGIWRLIERMLVHRTSATIMTTECRGEIFSERYGVEKPTIIKNTQYYRPLIKSNLLHEQLKISEQTKIVIYQGLIEKGRGLDVLVESMRRLSGVALVIIGYGSYKEKLITDVSKCSWKERIHILDAVPWEILAQYTASADLGVSLVQNTCMNNRTMLSNKLFEYLTAGLPVVFPNFPAWNEFISKYRVGKVVNETDPESVAAAIEEILSDTNAYHSMSVRAHNCIKNDHNWDIEGRKLTELYKNTINKSNF